MTAASKAQLSTAAVTAVDVDLDQVAQLPSQLLGVLTWQARHRENKELWDRGANLANVYLDPPPPSPTPRPWEPYTDIELIDRALEMVEDPWWTYERAAPVLASAARRSNLPAGTLAAALGVFA
jgi:hypothetical protein